MIHTDTADIQNAETKISRIATEIAQELLKLPPALASVRLGEIESRFHRDLARAGLTDEQAAFFVAGMRDQVCTVVSDLVSTPSAGVTLH